MSLRASLALLMLIFPLSVWAVLGESAASIQADQTKLKAAMRPGASHTNYSVQVIQTPAGITIKEFMASNGQVFAVSWKGPVLPDLKQLLGQYFGDYVTAARSKRGGHHHLLISQPQLVIHSQGHMRAFFGMAYLPGKLPAGVSPGDLQ